MRALSREIIVWRRNYINSDKKSSRITICDVLRELHRRTDDPASLALIETANDMAKRMQNKLKFYSLKTKDRTTLTVNDVGEMVWLNKEEYKSK